MNIKRIFDKSTDFAIKKIIEFSGVLLIITSLLLIVAIASYSPEDPNYIFEEEKKISNLLGFRGSFTSDIFFQSIGIISYLIPITLIFTGFSILKRKKIFILFENIFFLVLYSIFGSFFFSYFYKESFWLTINGNGGFVGEFFYKSFFYNVTTKYEEIIYYLLISIILFFFLISINFKMKSLLNVLKFFFKNFKNKDEKNDSIVFENTSKEEEPKIYEGRKQENFSFDKKKDENTKLIFRLPKDDILNKPKQKKEINKNEVDIDEKFLERILLDFGVEGQIKKINKGPVVTLNEFEPAAGVKVSKIINLSEDIARNTSSESARISTIPGSNTVGIELPNVSREDVYLKEIISNPNFLRKEYKLPIALGKSISGVPIVGDLSTMPHLLIAGTTGSGKSVCINTIILSLLFKHSPDKCKFILIDPKMLELSTYEGLPHLLCPVITEAKKAASVLGWVVKEMESRYRLMTREGVRNIDGYNQKHKLPMPYIVVVVDEMSDLMHVAGKEIEGYIQKLSQMARASGIHIIMATQRPSVDVITGTIKANFPTRISFQVSSKIDSRTILGEQGAEQLLGKGDMLYMSSANKIIRIHAPFVSDEEINKVNDFVRAQAEPDYVDQILNFLDKKENEETNNNDENQDELYENALQIVKSEGKASTSFLQRKLQIGYNRAARIIDVMEERGEISKANHVGKREVLK